MNNFEYISNKFPKAIKTSKLLTQYFDTASIVVSHGLLETDIDKVFSLLVDDYLRYTIDPDQLAELCEKLYLISEGFPHLKNSRIVSFLLEVADLEIYLRKDFEKIPKLLDEIVVYSQNSPK